MKRKTVKILFSLVIAIALLLPFLVFAQELDTGLEYGKETGLGNTDPRIVVARIIRVIFGFLGVVALGLIMYAGWLFTTASGNVEKTDKAKKILVGAVVGLIIVLSSFAIVSLILNKLLDASGAGRGSGAEDASGLGAGGGASGGGLASCDGNSLTPSCDPDSAICAEDEYCDSGCLCRPRAGYGESCDSDQGTPECEAAAEMCGEFLKCEADKGCLCGGDPVIKKITPLDQEKTPNGAPGNFITLNGLYFGQEPGQVYFWGGGDYSVPAKFPDSVNKDCVDYWHDREIIVIVPKGAVSGPVKVITADKRSDTTHDERGPMIKDFAVNDKKRPGLCAILPASGSFNEEFALLGAGFEAEPRGVFFGGETSSTTANDVSAWSASAVKAKAPNVKGGSNPVFVEIAGGLSNSLEFEIIEDDSVRPIVEYIDPEQGGSGQYITIYGKNFNSFKQGVSLVNFFLPADPENLIPADVSFPDECQGKWWHDSYITVIVPKASVGDYRLIVANSDKFVSASVDFKITSASPGPGICSLSPANGPVGFGVSVWGDNFKNEQGGGAAIFYNEKNALLDSWSGQNISVKVPSGAQTGPFAIRQNDKISNRVPFKVGNCSVDSECDQDNGEVCCPSGTYWSGICRLADDCNSAASGGCVYGWSFSTAAGPGLTLTCAGYSNAEMCLSAGTCPNSPGECRTAGEAATGAFCGNDFCNKTYSACSGQCVYDEASNKCRLSGAVCETESKDLISGFTAECRETEKGKNYWQINASGASCPAGTFLDTNRWCTIGSPGAPRACSVCQTGLSCVDGSCSVPAEVCPKNSTCDSGSGQCLRDNEICECCCRVGHDLEDCCAGLECASGGCGSGGDYGLCSGCRVELDSNKNTKTAEEKAASDKACNCSGHKGKYCDLDGASGAGVCRDAANKGEACYDEAYGATCNNSYFPPCSQTDLASGEELFCDKDNGCTCQPKIGKDVGFGESCLSEGETVCQPDTLCANGKGFCDKDKDCTCQPAGLPGEKCVDEAMPLCRIGISGCFAGYECLNNSFNCRCCCNPGDKNQAGLTCVADKLPCSSGQRGLYCGCSSNEQCGDKEIIGCGSDTCCRSRPAIAKDSSGQDRISPSAESLNVCRNAIVSAVFTEFMDTASLSGNVFLAGDYGASPCPAGTTFIALNKGSDKKSVWERALYVLKKPFKKIAAVVSGRGALALGPDADHNYCLSSVKAEVYNNAAEQTVLNLLPAKLLDGNRTYYVIIKGDGNLDGKEGVKSYYGTGLNGGEDLDKDGQEEVPVFNSLAFPNSYVWSFKTRSELGRDNGLCKISRVELEPDAYLFNTNLNDYNEDDNDPAKPGFDMAEDADKVIVARALSSEGQELSPLADVYDWTWDWFLTNSSVANFVNVSGLANNRRLVRAAEGVEDGRTTARATANVSDGAVFTGEAELFVFICANPWPAVNRSGYWRPWRDKKNNCSGQDCANFNYELYYCRDVGGVGTADDLPAILSDKAIIRKPEADDSLLKEYYFFQEEAPSVKNKTLRAEDQLTGGKVYIHWDAVSEAAGYKIYYGTESGSYNLFEEVSGQSSTSRIISGLKNGQKYYFVFTAYYKNRSESEYSLEASVAPTDVTAPPGPKNLNVNLAGGKVELSWESGGEDSARFKVSYGTVPRIYGKIVDVGAAKSAAISGLKEGITYYFAVSALDKYNNESIYSNEVSAKIAPSLGQ